MSDTVSKPLSVHDAGLVPCAESGISTLAGVRPLSRVVGADHHHAGELALRAGRRLQRDAREAADLAQRALEAPT